MIDCVKIRHFGAIEHVPKGDVKVIIQASVNLTSAIVVDQKEQLGQLMHAVILKGYVETNHK